MKLTILIGALILLSVSAFMGETQLDIQKILDPDAIEYLLFWDLRAPRVVVAFSSGAILALGGLVFQAVFRNSLTTPFTLGVSSGATLATAFGIIFLPASLVAFSSIFSFFGAFSTVLLLFLFARVLNTMQTGSLLLIGIALSF
ncbi:MAG: iron ABC transporter permease, partial [Sulfuricurvum sp. 24-42-5]